MVFYLKYRPQKIKELDNEYAREKLISILSGRNIPHAFLFTGPKGLGKTSAARIIAKSINCTNKTKGSFEPCNKCKSCVSITNGSNLDVLEIDGASNRGIDEIRDLREKVRLSPVSEKKKVYIIDEVHMLTTEAFNALLKTLEEPPEHVVFILCTTEPQKVPDTVRSRCLHISFTKANEVELTRSLERIVKGEGISVEPDALSKIASLSDGSFRDAAKILEEIALDAGRKKITNKLIEDTFKTSSINSFLDSIVKALFNKDQKEAIGVLTKASQEGTDFKYFAESLINRLHEELIKTVADGKDSLLSIPELMKLISLMSNAYSEMKYSAIPQLPLEIAIIEWTLQDQISSTAKEEDVPDESYKDSPKAFSQNDTILKELIDNIKLSNFSIAGVLRSCTVEKVSKDSLVISTMFKFHKEKLEEKNSHKLIEDAARKILGDKVEVSFLLKSKGGDLR